MNELSNKLETFYDLSETEQQNTLESVLAIANSDPEKFMQGIYKEEFNNLNFLPIIYEALSKDLNNWADFFLAEINRLFETARKSITPKKILNHLNEFAYIDPKRFKHRDKIIDILKKELENDHPTFRYYAISLLPDFVEENDYQTIKKIKSLLTDPNWKIRYWTHLALQDLNKLENHEKLSLTDRIKVKLMDTMKFE